MEEVAPQSVPATQESESLLKRLAGPSSGKAGLAKDQTEINRIISDASKGSKFYENEKKKDKEVTARIEKLLGHRDEALKTLDVAKVEASVGHLIEQLEKKRDLTQIIVHVDMDAFFANVELLDNSSLAGKPFAVVGKGVLTTASYDARKFGVRSGMAAFIAKKLCPELTLVENRHWRYSEISSQIMEIFHRYDPDMCPAGCDEGYLNITPYCEEHMITAEECVQEMRQTVFQEIKLTVSAGIAPNKMLAKICSDKNKPNGQYQLEFDAEAIKEFMRDLPIRKIPGIGRVTERLLEAIGIKTCGDIYTQRAMISVLDKYFGLTYLLQTYLGIASNVVQPYTREERKSIGAERTFTTLHKLEDILAKLEEVANELEKDMEEDGWVGHTVTLKYKLDTYQVFTRAKSVSHWVSKKEELFNIGKDLLLAEYPLKLRLIGLRVTKLKDLRDAGDAGIKRFFESSKTSTSPRKRIKLDAEDDEVVGVTDLQEQSTHELHGVDGATDNSASTSTKPLSTRSAKYDAINASASIVECDPVGSTSNNSEMHQCPICGKTMETDNIGLNAHIDFCLSRGAILEAQAHANLHSLTPKKFTGLPQPDSGKSREQFPEAGRPKVKITSKKGK